MPSATEPASYSKADPALLREIVAAAEKRLESQLTASLAADQRALVLAGFFSATSAALVGGATALLVGAPQQTFLGGLAMLAAAGLLVALGLTAYAARPVGWSYPSTRPSAWIADIAAGKSEADRLADLAADAERKAGENADLMRANGRCVLAALIIAAVTITLSAVAISIYFCAAAR